MGKRERGGQARAWWLYMVRTKTGALYTGITTDVARRFREHASGGARAARYLRGNAPAAVVFRKRIGPKALAAKVEWRVKRLVRAKKEAIVAAGRLRVDRVTGEVRIAT